MPQFEGEISIGNETYKIRGEFNFMSEIKDADLIPPGGLSVTTQISDRDRLLLARATCRSKEVLEKESEAAGIELHDAVIRFSRPFEAKH